MIAGEGGLRTESFAGVFGGRLHLPRGEFLAQVTVARDFVGLPWFHAKKTRQEKIGYPVLTMVIVRDREGDLHTAIGGPYEFPFHSEQLDAVLNDARLDLARRIDGAVASLPAPVLDELEASAGYPRFVLRNTLEEAIDALGGVA